MATNIELNTKINTANSAQSLGELRKSLKDLIGLQSQVGSGSAEFEKLSKSINHTESRLGDLQDSFSTLRGSGVERLNSSLGLLRDGLTGADPEKIGIAFKGLGAAMSAVPIFFLVEGFKLLIDNFDKIGPVLKNFFNLTSDSEKEVKRLTIAIEQEHKANELLFNQLENHIKILEAQGASEGKILEVKRQLTNAKIKEAELDIELQKAKIRDILLNDDISESINRNTAALLRKLGKDLEADAFEKKLQIEKNERIKEASDLIRTDLINIQNLKTNLQVEEIKAEKKQTTELKKIREDKAKEEEAERLAKIKRDQEEEKQQLEAEQFLAKKDEEDKKKKAEEADALDAANAEKLAISAQLAETILAKQKADRERDFQEFVADNQARLQVSQSGIQALQGLSDLAFSIKQANTKKGSEEEEKAARKQFVINKGLQISTATITGIQGVLSALTAPSILPEPLATVQRVVQAVSIGATTAATIAKISAAQFKSSGGASSGASVSAGGGASSGSSAGQGASLPNQRIQPTNFRRETVGQIGSPGGANTPNNQQSGRSEVSVVEISRVANKVRATESMAKF